MSCLPGVVRSSPLPAGEPGFLVKLPTLITSLYKQSPADNITRWTFGLGSLNTSRGPRAWILSVCLLCSLHAVCTLALVCDWQFGAFPFTLNIPSESPFHAPVPFPLFCPFAFSTSERERSNSQTLPLDHFALAPCRVEGAASSLPRVASPPLVSYSTRPLCNHASHGTQRC